MFYFVEGFCKQRIHLAVDCTPKPNWMYLFYFSVSTLATASSWMCYFLDEPDSCLLYVQVYVNVRLY